MSGVGPVSEEESGLGWRPGFVTYVILTTVLASTTLRYFKRRHMVSLMNKLPGPTSLPIIGNSLQISIDSEILFATLDRFCCEYGEVVRLWMGSHPFILISSPRTVEALLSNTRNLDKSDEYRFLHPWLGTGLLTATGSKWHSRRKILTPAFHFKILEEFLDTFNRHAAKFAEKLKSRADGELFDVFQLVTLCTLDIICETAMGRTLNAQDNEDCEYVKALKKINKMVNDRVFNAWQQPDILYWLLGYTKEMDDHIKVLHKFSLDTIKGRRRIFEDNNKFTNYTSEEDKLIGKKRKLAFLDLLLEASKKGQTLTDEDIREEVDTFMFEGHDTTASSLNWALYMLGRHPQIQAKVFKELDTIFGESDRPATMDDLREMKYLERCIKESLRILPTVSLYGRTIKEDMDLGDFQFPAGATVMAMTYRLHRDPKQFPDPEKFDPDRFLQEAASKRHPFAYVPFSAGPRNCIGQKFAMMEEKVVLSQVFRQYRVVSDTAREDLHLISELTLSPKNGNPIRLYPRKQ